MSKFGELVAEINEYLLEDKTITSNQIEERIQEAYENDEIASSQYEYLNGLIFCLS